MTVTNADWARYEALLSADEDRGLIPMLGIQLVIGINDEGQRTFLIEFDTDATIDWPYVSGILDIIQSQAKFAALKQMGLHIDIDKL